MTKRLSSIRTFVDFLQVPIVFYKTIGEELYEHRSTSRLKTFLYKVLFFLGFLNFNVLVLGEMVYFVKALKSFSTVLEAIAVAPCIGFSLVADFKQGALAVHKRTLRNHLSDMELIFPSTLQKQFEYDLLRYEKKMRRVMMIFSVLCFAYTSTFSMYPICRSVIRYYFMGVPVFERDFGFLIWYPYNATNGNFVYTATYLSQVHAGYLAGVAFLSADLLLVSSVTLLCMHFNYISNQLENFSGFVGTQAEEKNINFLQQLVTHHSKCLELSEHVNIIFNFSLLLNFLTASLTICFIGFQVTASTVEDFIKYSIFLLASMLQVFVICYYGDELITASSHVGDAAYNQNWFERSTKYKKMLLLVMMRSQKEASIRPPTFPPISFNTYMKVISMSYQFFALLKTTYYKD